MKKGTSKGRGLVELAAIALVWLFLAGTALPATYVTISGGEPLRTLACVPLEPANSFSLEFINSIYGAPVRETFVYDPGHGVSLVKVESPSAGVFEYYGLEPPASGMAKLNRPVGEIRLRSHDYEHHRLTAGERSIHLKSLVPDGEPLLLSVGTFPDDRSCIK